MGMKKISVTDIGGFRLGNAENGEKGTGCTVIICEEGAVGGVDVRGGGPATRETDLLRSENTVNAVNAVVLSGGSAFGLEAASGVMRELAERSIGFDAGDGIVVPIVCGASLYDLPVGDHKAFPDVSMGIQAVQNAYDGIFANGNHGAGTGATAGKLKGYERAMKTGLGTFACGDGVVEVGAIAAVNAVGDIYNGAGNIIAGLRSEDGKAIYGTIKTLKSMVHDNISLADESTPYVSRTDMEEALAAVARQFKEEREAAKKASAAHNDAPVEQTAEESADEFTEEPAEEIVNEINGEAAEGSVEEFNEEPAVESCGEQAEENNGQPAEEFTWEPVDEPAEETAELPQESAEEPAEFIPETPAVDHSGDNYREYAEVSIPVMTTNPESYEETAADEHAGEPAEETVEMPEESAEEFTEETVEATAEEPAEETAEETATEEAATGSSGSEQETPESPEYDAIEESAEEFIPEPADEPAEETVELPEESAEEFTEETVEAVAEEPAEETAERSAAEEAAADLADEPSVSEQETPESPEYDAMEEAAEEPVNLTREEMGYEIVFNTTISCLITNASLTKSQANKLASILHDAYARAIKPVHGTLDGDTVFVLATGRQKVNFDAFAALATDVMQYAIIDGAMSAEGAYGLPSAKDMK